MLTGRYVKVFLAAIAPLVMAGCAVQPNPLDMHELQGQAHEDMQTLAAAEPAIKQPLTVDQAVARALLYNRKQHIHMLQQALASKKLDAANYQMLPSLTASAGYALRNKYAATRSVPFKNGSPTPTNTGNKQYSVGQEKRGYQYGIDFTWSILDFGLSYVRAHQSADKYLISQEQVRKALQNLARQTRTAYWRAVSANRLLVKVDPLMAQVKTALDNSQAISKNSLADPLTSYSYRRSLLDVRHSLASMRADLVGAKEKLARLMGLPPTAHIPLPEYADDELTAPTLTLDLPTMEMTALLMRPEVRSADYRVRISRDDVRAAFLQMFPDLSLSLGYQYDSNKFLRYNDWASAGATVAYDLLKALKMNKNRQAAKAAVTVADQQRLAASLAVLTQVHLSVLNYQASKQAYNVSSNYLTVSRKIAGLVERQASQGNVGNLTVIKERLNALMAELRRDLAYTHMRGTVAQVYASIGLDLYPAKASDTPQQLAKQIANRVAIWQTGDIAVVARPIADQQPELAAEGDPNVARFQFASDTFAVVGNVHYKVSAGGDRDTLPAALSFDSATRTFSAPVGSLAEPVTVIVKAINDAGVYAYDRFELQPAQSGAL